MADIIARALAKSTDEKLSKAVLGGLDYQKTGENELTVTKDGVVICTLVLPKGDKGDKATGIDTIALNDEQHLVVTLDDEDATEIDLGELPKGEDGFSPVITENADNDENTYKLDITTKDGTITTPNLIPAKGTTDYEKLENLPKINGVEVKGELSLKGLSIQSLIAEWVSEKEYTTGNLVIHEDLIYIATTNTSSATFELTEWKPLGANIEYEDEDIDFDALLDQEVDTIEFSGDIMIINGIYSYDGETLTLLDASFDGETVII